MKLLITADGPTLESPVARRFGHATHFLTVESETGTIIGVYESRNTPTPTLIPALAAAGIRTVMTGTVGPAAFGVLSTTDLRVVLASRLTVTEAIKRFNRGLLKVLDGPALQQVIEEHQAHRIEHRQQHSRSQHHLALKSPFAAATPRGRHHIQQFGGRGH
jgi:predicted Fe-Mo cluster-binding NifX family protein